MDNRRITIIYCMLPDDFKSRVRYITKIIPSYNKPYFLANCISLCENKKETINSMLKIIVNE